MANRDNDSSSDSSGIKDDQNTKRKISDNVLNLPNIRGKGVRTPSPLDPLPNTGASSSSDPFQTPQSQRQKTKRFGPGISDHSSNWTGNTRALKLTAQI